MTVLGVAAAADLLRLLVLPGFAWAAYRDVRTRRVASRLWVPLLAIGALAFAVEAAGAYPFADYAGRLFLVRAGFSLLFLIPFSLLAYRLAAFGGADAKALVVLAVAFPTTPQYVVPLWLFPEATWLHTVAFPVYPSTLGVGAMSALTNAVLLGAVYIVALAVANAVAGRFSPAMAVGRWTPVDDLPETHGQLLRVSGLRPERGLDLDALRMYLRWRGTTLAALRADPAAHRDPGSVEETHAPTDGAVHDGPRTDGGVDDGGFEFPDSEGDATGDTDATGDPSDAADTTGDTSAAGDAAGDTDGSDTDGDGDTLTVDDPWAAERFLTDIEGSAYGTTPETLREGLDRVTREEALWVSPGLPFLVPLFAGLVLALTYGDVLTVALGALGLV
ncbi:prepilin peptidase [Halobaculum sp. CBA1158]|uniref:A24 family peptidase n=1 Tax=Halobaculum sp. CBA1158 TaxID=2904243 RepID=UPI001F41E919|nr:A24 family peptidase [Halobaculum sp. CBA1158]UIP00008.1 prepilin peptidase [Halobaculum sp. CBA1158]